MHARRIELFYYPVFKGFKIPTKKELQQKIANYLTHHPELRPHQKEPWHCSRVSPGFNQEAVDCYFIVAPQPLKEPERTDGMVCFSSIELYNFLKRRTLFLETTGNLPTRLKLV